MMNRTQTLPDTDMHIYTLSFTGVLDEDFLASFCPEGTVATAVAHRTTLTNLRADQAAVIGVIRRLHNLGCTLVYLSAAPGEEK